MLAFPQHVWTQTSTPSRPSISWLKQSIRKSRYCSVAASRGDEVHQRLLDLDHLAAGLGELAKLPVHHRGHVPHQLALVRPRTRPCARSSMLATSWVDTVPNFTGRSVRDCAIRQSLSNSSGAPLPTAADDLRAAARRRTPLQAASPAGRSTRRSPQRPLAERAREALERVAHPGLTCQIGIEVVVAVGEDVETGPLLIRDDRRDRVAEAAPGTRCRASASDSGPPQSPPRNHGGRGHDPVTVVGSMIPSVAGEHRCATRRYRGRRGRRSLGVVAEHAWPSAARRWRSIAKPASSRVADPHASKIAPVLGRDSRRVGRSPAHLAHGAHQARAHRIPDRLEQPAR